MNKIYDILQIVIVFGIIIAIYTVLIITIILNKKTKFFWILIGILISISIIFGFSFYRIIKYLNEKNKEIIFRLNNKNNGTMEYIKGHFIITQV